MSYPIKYAVEELKVSGGFLENYQDVTVGFIVSKCYIVEDRISYFGSLDKPSVSHIVTFPYKRFEDFSIYMKRSLNFDYYYEERRIPERESLTYPDHIVYELFDTYEEAFLVAESRNSILRGDILSNASSSHYDKLSKEFARNMVLCKEYECYIAKRTTDMVVTKDEIGKCKVKN